MSNSPKTIFFIGSGFSKSLKNVPIQDKFMNEVFSGKPDGTEGKTWKEIIIAAIKNDNGRTTETESKFLDACNDFEYLMSYIYQGDVNIRKKNKEQNESDPNPYKKANELVRMAINHYFEPSNIKNEKKESAIALSNFKSIVSNYNKEDIAFITTNYDLILEQSLMDANFCQFKDINYIVGGSNSGKGIPIIKLHGSINWLENRYSFKESKELVSCFVAKFKVTDENKHIVYDLECSAKSGKYMIERKRGDPAQICIWDKKVVQENGEKLKKLLKENKKNIANGFLTFEQLLDECDQLKEKPRSEYLLPEKFDYLKIVQGEFGHYYYQPNGDNDEKLLPITIPFYYQKEDWFSQRWGDFNKDLMEKAKNLLDECDNIVFVGYGFPAADFYLMHFFNERNINNKQRIVNIGRSNEAFIDNGINVKYITGRYLHEMTIDNINDLKRGMGF